MAPTRFRLRPWGSFVALFILAAACDDGAEELRLFVGPQLVPCVGVGPMECLQVRQSPDEEWQLFYDSIEGFDFEPGYLYELRVERHEVSPVPADGSSYRYVLIRVVRKEPAGS